MDKIIVVGISYVKHKAKMTPTNRHSSNITKLGRHLVWNPISHRQISSNCGTKFIFGPISVSRKNYCFTVNDRIDVSLPRGKQP